MHQCSVHPAIFAVPSVGSPLFQSHPVDRSPVRTWTVLKPFDVHRFEESRYCCRCGHCFSQRSLVNEVMFTVRTHHSDGELVRQIFEGGWKEDFQALHDSLQRQCAVPEVLAGTQQLHRCYTRQFFGDGFHRISCCQQATGECTCACSHDTLHGDFVAVHHCFQEPHVVREREESARKHHVHVSSGRAARRSSASSTTRGAPSTASHRPGGPLGARGRVPHIVDARNARLRSRHGRCTTVVVRYQLSLQLCSSALSTTPPSVERNARKEWRRERLDGLAFDERRN